ncbi:PREDICTED: uncharacterized protein LOC108781877 [Cyphomyrmex costatus]|uniref:uncharacterized protein LOC108781877 n=1 Tax=Cyphomyrmex costatus TaxID=456900 RepID=UPI0008521EB5|nr:PREDICTED: uncharacterized protein LOC108781877 [Cyphomyrmex costatus]
MTKITIINCIIAAVCIFQTAEAGLLDKSLIGSILGTVQDQVENIKEVGKVGIQKGQEAINDLTNSQVDQTNVSTSTPCTDVRNKIQGAVEHVMKTFDTCIVQKANSADIEKFTSKINNLQTNISKNFQDASSCLRNPLDISCFRSVRENFFKLIPLIEEAVNAAFNLIGMFPNMRICFETGIHQLSDQVTSQITKNIGQCVQSFMPSFKL